MAAKPKKKQADLEGETIQIAAGEAVRLYCFTCSTEFEIKHEPKYRSTQDIPGGTLGFCPYCGAESLEAM